MDASIFDSALSHTRRSHASEKRQENSVSNFGRFRLWTSFESSPVSGNLPLFMDLYNKFYHEIFMMTLNLQIYDLVSNWSFPKQAARDDEIRFFDGRRRSV